MRQTSNKPKVMPGSSWSSFKLPSGGTAQELRKGAATIKTKVNAEQKIFGSSSLLDGGTKVKG